MKKLLKEFYDLLSQPQFQTNGYETEDIYRDGFFRSDGRHHDYFEIIEDSDKNQIAIRWINTYEGDSHRGDNPTFFTRFVPLEVDSSGNVYIKR